MIVDDLFINMLIWLGIDIVVLFTLGYVLFMRPYLKEIKNDKIDS